MGTGTTAFGNEILDNAVWGIMDVGTLAGIELQPLSTRLSPATVFKLVAVDSAEADGVENALADGALVPEPATFLLVSLALLAIIYRGRQYQR